MPATNLRNKGVCSLLAAKTLDLQVLKLGIEDHIYPLEVVGYILFQYSYPQGWGRPKSGSGGPCNPNSAYLWKFPKKIFFSFFVMRKAL